MKKKIKKAKNVRQIKATGAGLEGFMDWVDLISSEPTEEREDDMSSLAGGFITRMCKQAASAQRETTFSSEGLDDKQPKWSGLDGEVQKSSAVITMDSPE